LGSVENDILKGYLAEVARVHATGAGTSETSYYGALQGALNAIGAALTPRVYCLAQMSGSAGFPDFGLFTDVQSGRGGVATVWAAGGPVPERGVVEADDIPAPLSAKRGSKQVANYLSAYGLVLITNYRDFELIEPNVASGVPQVVEMNMILEDKVPQKHEVTSVLKHLSRISAEGEADQGIDWEPHRSRRRSSRSSRRSNADRRRCRDSDGRNRAGSARPSVFRTTATVT
jgi:hypothetical protein